MKMSQVQEFMFKKKYKSKYETHLIGSKWILACGEVKYRKVEILPLLDEKNQIIGTQLKIDGDLIKIEKLREDSDRVTFKNNFMLFSYKIISKNFTEKFILLEVQFSDYFMKFIHNFSDYEKNTLLDNARNFLLDLVPKNLMTLANKTFE